jgi:hypothetical protein
MIYVWPEADFSVQILYFQRRFKFRGVLPGECSAQELNTSRDHGCIYFLRLKLHFRRPSSPVNWEISQRTHAPGSIQLWPAGISHNNPRKLKLVGHCLIGNHRIDSDIVKHNGLNPSQPGVRVHSFGKTNGSVLKSLELFSVLLIYKSVVFGLYKRRRWWLTTRISSGRYWKRFLFGSALSLPLPWSRKSEHGGTQCMQFPEPATSVIKYIK